MPADEPSNIKVTQNKKAITAEFALSSRHTFELTWRRVELDILDSFMQYKLRLDGKRIALLSSVSRGEHTKSFSVEGYAGEFTLTSTMGTVTVAGKPVFGFNL